MKTEIERGKREIDLKEYAKKYYGVESNQRGMAHCPNPDHGPDIHPSFQFWRGDDGIYRYTDHHTGEKGTIIDFVMKMEGCSMQQAIQSIRNTEGIRVEAQDRDSTVEYYIYRSLDNEPIYRKGKRHFENGQKMFWFEHMENGVWTKGKGPHKLMPYNLPESERYRRAIICEGEKDAETVKRLVKDFELDFWVTSAPNGKASWPNCITRYFSHIKEVTFLYDVGAEEDSKKHAAKLKEAYPHMKVYIARVPMEEEGADITDYVNRVRRQGDES